MAAPTGTIIKRRPCPCYWRLRGVGLPKGQQRESRHPYPEIAHVAKLAISLDVRGLHLHGIAYLSIWYAYRSHWGLSGLGCASQRANREKVDSAGPSSPCTTARQTRRTTRPAGPTRYRRRTRRASQTRPAGPTRYRRRTRPASRTRRASQTRPAGPTRHRRRTRPARQTRPAG